MFTYYQSIVIIVDAFVCDCGSSMVIVALHVLTVSFHLVRLEGPIEFAVKYDKNLMHRGRRMYCSYHQGVPYVGM